MRKLRLQRSCALLKVTQLNSIRGETRSFVFPRLLVQNFFQWATNLCGPHLSFYLDFYLVFMTFPYLQTSLPRPAKTCKLEFKQ